MTKKSPYHRVLNLTKEACKNGYVELDCYDVLELVGISSSRLQHAAKKVLYAGSRGHKDLVKDLKEAIWSLEAELIKIKRDRETHENIDK